MKQLLATDFIGFVSALVKPNCRRKRVPASKVRNRTPIDMEKRMARDLKSCGTLLHFGWGIQRRGGRRKVTKNVTLVQVLRKLRERQVPKLVEERLIVLNRD